MTHTFERKYTASLHPLATSLPAWKKALSAAAVSVMLMLLLAVASPAQTVNCTGVTAWAPGIQVTVGELVTYAGLEYKTIQAHTTETGWEPPNVPALFSLVGTCTAATPTPTPTPTAKATPSPTPNAIAARVLTILQANNVGGVEGVYLKQVGGSVLANYNDTTVYEPASSIKAVAMLYALTQVQSGKVSLNAQIPHYTNGPNSCPDPVTTSSSQPTEALSVALREMMWHSDNARAREVTDYFTDASINAYAKSIGLTHTSFNHILGCGGPIPNTLTQDDAGKLYEGVAKQTLLNTQYSGTFFSLTAGKAQYESEGYDWTAIWYPDLPNMIAQLAPNYTAAQQSAYQNDMDLGYKAGDYVFCQDGPCDSIISDYAESGWFEVPYCTTGGTTYKQYVFGLFLYNVPQTSYVSGSNSVAFNNFLNAKSELMREQLQAGLTSCYQKPLDTVSWTPESLIFASQTVGTHSAVQKITFTNKQTSSVNNVFVSIFGEFSQTNNCPSTLASGASCTISVTFSPTTAISTTPSNTERTGAVVVTNNGSGDPQTIELTGFAQ